MARCRPGMASKLLTPSSTPFLRLTAPEGLVVEARGAEGFDEAGVRALGRHVVLAVAKLFGVLVAPGFAPDVGRCADRDQSQDKPDSPNPSNVEHGPNPQITMCADVFRR